MSPILFASVTEWLANAFRKDEPIKGVGYKEKSKMSLFPDDTLLTIEDPLMVKLHLRLVDEIAGLQINWNKSESLQRQKQILDPAEVHLPDMCSSTVGNGMQHAPLHSPPQFVSAKRAWVFMGRHGADVGQADFNNKVAVRALNA